MSKGRSHEGTGHVPAQPVSRRQFIKRVACGSLVLGSAGTLLSACAAPVNPEAEGQAAAPPSENPSQLIPFPAEDGTWSLPGSNSGSIPAGPGEMQIANIGTFPFEASQVKTLRPDIFQPGHFSLFDILVHLSENRGIALDFHFDEQMDTHVIDAIDGHTGWWYEAYYSNGWYESNAFRMDMYPYKNDTTMRLDKTQGKRLNLIYDSFREELGRLAGNGGKVIIPELTVRTYEGERVFQGVEVTAHNVRSDVLKPGNVTALDALLSLAERGDLSQIGLTWHERIGQADPVDSYWVSQIDEARADGGCGFVYETGPLAFSGFGGTHIHIPSDTRITLSPEYALWFWICLGRGRVGF